MLQIFKVVKLKKKKNVRDRSKTDLSLNTCPATSQDLGRFNKKSILHQQKWLKCVLSPASLPHALSKVVYTIRSPSTRTNKLEEPTLVAKRKIMMMITVKLFNFITA